MAHIFVYQKGDYVVHPMELGDFVAINALGWVMEVGHGQVWYMGLFLQFIDNVC